MKSNQSRCWIILTVLIGTLMFVQYNLLDFSIAVWDHHVNSNYSDLLNLSWLVSIPFFLFGLFVVINSFQNSTWTASCIILIVIHVILITIGFTDGIEKSRDLFMLFFALSMTMWLFILYGLGIFVRHYFNNVNMHIFRKIWMLAIGVLLGFVIYTSLSLVYFITIIHFWFFSAFLIASIAYISKLHLHSTS